MVPDILLSLILFSRFLKFVELHSTMSSSISSMESQGNKFILNRSYHTLIEYFVVN